MTASPPKANGSTRPRTPLQFADWRITTPATEERRAPESSNSEPAVDLVAAAEAATIRARGEAEAEAIRIAAEAAAKAEIIKAEEEARKQKIANDRAEKRFEEEQAARAARIAKANREREEADRAAAAAAAQAEIDRQVEAKKAQVVEKADKKWRGWAIAFYTLCAAVALPVQCSAFWDRDKPWMVGAPVLLEIAALVVAFGTAAAVANKRPHWHFRLITWVLAFIAASVNLWHGMQEFDPATAVGTALASVFGPGVWDLHEHGRIRRRDGVPTRQERKAIERAEKRAAAEKDAAERLEAEKQAYIEKGVREVAAKLARDRASKFPKVWEHAEKLAAALGETTVTEAVWRRAHKDVEGTDPGDSAEYQNLRNTAARRLLHARADVPDKAVWKIDEAQVNPQVPPTRRRGSVTGPPVRGTRRAGDTPKFVDAARKQAAIAAKNAAEKDES